MRVGVRPNPTGGDDAELLLHVSGEGSVRVGIYTMLGEQVRELPAAQVSGAGDYTQRINLSGLQPGIYLIVAQQGPHKASTKVTVMGR